MHKVILGIGGNTGNKHENFNKVYGLIRQEVGLITLVSSVYQTPPWGFNSVDDFLNQVIVVETLLTPVELLSKIHLIEACFGRKREQKGYSSRDMDIDILFYDDLIINKEDLVIPHPLISKRLFVLVPLAEILPDLIHPVLQKSSIVLRDESQDTSVIQRLE